MSRILIVGESNPYGGGDEYALYPAPDGCSGHRLCCLILGMHRLDYLELFERCNLVRGKWSVPTARARAGELQAMPDMSFILLGSKVCAAFGTTFKPFDVDGRLCKLPHPSGRNMLWNEPGAFARARNAVAQLAPRVGKYLGRGGEKP